MDRPQASGIVLEKLFWKILWALTFTFLDFFWFILNRRLLFTKQCLDFKVCDDLHDDRECAVDYQNFVTQCKAYNKNVTAFKPLLPKNFLPRSFTKKFLSNLNLAKFTKGPEKTKRKVKRTLEVLGIWTFSLAQTRVPRASRFRCSAMMKESRSDGVNSICQSPVSAYWWLLSQRFRVRHSDCSEWTAKAW